MKTYYEKKIGNNEDQWNRWNNKLNAFNKLNLNDNYRFYQAGDVGNPELQFANFVERLKQTNQYYNNKLKSPSSSPTGYHTKDDNVNNNNEGNETSLLSSSSGNSHYEGNDKENKNNFINNDAYGTSTMTMSTSQKIITNRRNQFFNTSQNINDENPNEEGQASMQETQKQSLNLSTILNSHNIGMISSHNEILKPKIDRNQLNGNNNNINNNRCIVRKRLRPSKQQEIME